MVKIGKYFCGCNTKYDPIKNSYNVNLEKGKETEINKYISEILKAMINGVIKVNNPDIVDINTQGSIEKKELNSYVDKLYKHNYSDIKTIDGKIRNTHYLR